MQIYPAIDIRNGNCVRLEQGDFNKETIYHHSPVSVALDFVAQGATYLHIVDLDGARHGVGHNNEIIAEIVKKVNIPVQVGGGIRTLEDIEQRLSTGVTRIILGTVAVNNPEIVETAVLKYGDKIAVGIDAKDSFVAVSGWEEVSTVSALSLCLKMKDLGVKTIIYTDIAKDGMMCGINLASTKELIDNVNMNIIASGGVSSLKDLEEIKKIKASGVIIGKAIYSNAVQLKVVIEKFEKGE